MIRSRLSAAAVLSAAALALPTLAQTDAVAQAPAPTPARPSLLGGGDAAVPPAGDGLADKAFDSREALATVLPTLAQKQALARIPKATATWNRTGTPRTISVAAGTLTGPTSGAPLAIAKAWLRDNSAVFGLTAQDVAALGVERNHELPGIKATVLSFSQSFGGVSAGIGGILTVVVDRAGRVVSYAGDPVRTGKLVGSFDLTAAEALSSVIDTLVPGSGFLAKATGEVMGGYQVFAGSVLGPNQLVRKIAFPTADGGRAAYAVLAIKGLDEAWVTIVDAATGDPLFRKSLVAHESEGDVFENYPGAAKGGKLVTRSFGPTQESPGGWLDPTGLVGLPGITTLGNNANTAIAWTVPLVAVDQYNRPVALDGSFRYDFTNSWQKSGGSLTGYQPDANAAATNLFYHHNRIHDEYYEFGFTESGGNFQLVNKPGTTGLPADPIFGGAQSGALNLTEAVLPLGRNNANMLTLPDGIPGFTNMYLWEFVDDIFEGPIADGDFDASIIQHEYSHGLSNRYVGGGGLGSLGGTQSGAMGEGWGDWFAMNDLFRRGLTRTAVVAAYVGDEDRGIRNWNYAKSPATYGDYGYDMSGPEVHSDGEIWTAALWTLRTKILKTVRGNQKKASDIAEHLVMDAMPISPPSPSMLDMRDAIVKAGELRYKNTYTDLIWDAFAERGFGASAKTDGENDTTPRPGFDVPRKSLNGKLSLKLVNDSAGGPVKGARVLGGLFEGRTTPIFTTDKSGRGSAAFAAGTYTLTIQAPGYGIQRFRVPISKGRTLRKTIRLRPNLASGFSGARVVGTTSEMAALPAANAFDDTETTSWQTGSMGKAYNKAKAQSATVRLKKKSRIDQVSVSVLKPIGLPRFSAAKKVKVQTSMNGKKWRTAKVASFRFIQPRPAAPDLNLKTYRLKKGVKAKFVRAVPVKTFGDSGITTTAIVSEVQVFGKASGIKPKLPKPDKPVTLSGSVSVGNIAQGSLLGLDPYRPGVTELSWTCPGLPTANGVDAFMHRLPEGAGDGRHAATLDVSVPIGEFLLYFYDEDCAPMSGGGFALSGETITIPPGAVYSGFLLLYGAGASFDLVVTEPR